jgi:UDP-N-acetylmuramoylalanine--D-glutamate ligase
MRENFSGKNILIMGLGLNGGGLESALFLARRGAKITVTDLKSAEILRPSIKILDNYTSENKLLPVRYALGLHDIHDFENADIVIKNPAARPDSIYLKKARRIETDISLFLRENPARLSAVTGSKGKSFTSSALHCVLDSHHKSIGKGAAYLGGNITVSPLSFVDKLTDDDDVILELSSWQLGDLPSGMLKPRVSIITAIMSDHMDRYGSMENYIADKKLIYRNQDKSCLTVVYDGEWSSLFLDETAARTAVFGAAEKSGACGWYDAERQVCCARGPLGPLKDGESAAIAGQKMTVPGVHQRINLAAAGVALLDLGIDIPFINKCLSCFPGIEHRLEFFLERDGIRFYNDTAATIPEAAAAALDALGAPVLVTGGTDKALDFTPLVRAARGAKKIVLLSGTASDKLTRMFDAQGIGYDGPFDNLDAAVKSAVSGASRGDAVILSPGCASFGMFINEFDRGRRWKEAVCGYRTA